MIRVLVPVIGFALLNGRVGTALAAAVIAIFLAGYFQLQHFCRKQAHWWHTHGPRVKASAALSIIPIILVGPLVVRYLLAIVLVALVQAGIYGTYWLRQLRAGEAAVEGWHGVIEANRCVAELARAKAIAAASSARDRWEARPGRVRVSHDFEAARRSGEIASASAKPA
jgi:hypothetical protein